MFNCCKPFLVPHELTDSSLEKVQQQLNQINVSLGETPGPQLGGNGGEGGYQRDWHPPSGASTEAGRIEHRDCDLGFESNELVAEIEAKPQALRPKTEERREARS